MFNGYVLFTAFILDEKVVLSQLKSLIHRVVKSSRLPAKIAAYLVCILVSISLQTVFSK